MFSRKMDITATRPISKVSDLLSANQLSVQVPSPLANPNWPASDQPIRFELYYLTRIYWLELHLQNCWRLAQPIRVSDRCNSTNGRERYICWFVVNAVVMDEVCWLTYFNCYVLHESLCNTADNSMQLQLYIANVPSMFVCMLFEPVCGDCMFLLLITACCCMNVCAAFTRSIISVILLTTLAYHYGELSGRVPV